MYIKGKSCSKATAAPIRQDPTKIASLRLFGVSIAEYELVYRATPKQVVTVFHSLLVDQISFRTCTFTFHGVAADP